MDRFPLMLYKVGGPHAIHGGHFDTLVVNDDTENAQAQAEGWRDSTPGAVAAHEAAQAEAAAKLAEQAKAAETTPPTREELEQKARELGIDFSPNIGDKRLGERIAEKLAEQAKG